MPKGRCKDCGEVYYSWAFAEEDCPPETWICEKCGGQIELVEPDKVEDPDDL